MKKERVFITGGTGFVGANLTEYLIKRGFSDIKIYDNLSAGKKEHIDKIAKKLGCKSERKSKNKTVYKNSNRPLNLVLVVGDILDAKILNKEMNGYDVVIHLAAHTRVLESLKEPEENFKVNAIGTFNVLEASRKNKIKKFIFASSNAVVGEQISPISEKMVPKPLSPYGATKLFGEGLCSAYYYSYGLKTVSLRFANCYGPYSEHKTSVIAKFIRRAKRGLPLEVYGDGTQTRDFIHVSDVCQAIYRCVTNNSSLGGEVFQIATGKETRIIDLAKMVNRLFAQENNLKFSPSRVGEIRKNFSDIRKAKTLLGFNPEIKLEEGLKSLITSRLNE